MALQPESRSRILRHLIRQQLQNRLPPYIIFLIRGSQQPTIMLKVLLMNELLHSYLPRVRGLNGAPCSHSYKGRAAKLFHGGCNTTRSRGVIAKAARGSRVGTHAGRGVDIRGGVYLPCSPSNLPDQRLMKCSLVQA